MQDNVQNDLGLCMGEEGSCGEWKGVMVKLFHSAMKE